MRGARVEGTMSIAAPGRRLLRNIPLPFVQRSVTGGNRRPVTSSLSLTSMIDFLVVTVVFLLISFQPTESAAANGVKLPEATNISDMLDLPMIAVAKTQILLDGVPVGSTRLVEERKRVETIDELSQALVAKRQLWKQVHPERPFPGAVVLQLDQDTSSIVVKSLFHTSAHAGYPAISFMVERSGR